MAKIKPGDPVWVKIAASKHCKWWPAMIVTEEECELEYNGKKPVVARVHFPVEDTYEILFSEERILPFNCENKNEYLKLGKAIPDDDPNDLQTVFLDTVRELERKTGKMLVQVGYYDRPTVSPVKKAVESLKEKFNSKNLQGSELQKNLSPNKSQEEDDSRPKRAKKPSVLLSGDFIVGNVSPKKALKLESDSSPARAKSVKPEKTLPSPKKATKTKSESPKKKVSGISGSPKKKVSGVSVSPKKKLTGVNASPKKKVGGASESPKKKVKGRPPEKKNALTISPMKKLKLKAEGEIDKTGSTKMVGESEKVNNDADDMWGFKFMADEDENNESTNLDQVVNEALKGTDETAEGASASPVKRKGGRPPGAKNKPKANESGENSGNESGNEKKRSGAKNKAKDGETSSPIKRKAGRPPGAKNKPKEGDSENVSPSKKRKLSPGKSPRNSKLTGKSLLSALKDRRLPPKFGGTKTPPSKGKNDGTYCCDICGFSTTRQGIMLMHQRGHSTDYKIRGTTDSPPAAQVNRATASCSKVTQNGEAKSYSFAKRSLFKPTDTLSPRKKHKLNTEKPSTVVKLKTYSPVKRQPSPDKAQSGLSNASTPTKRRAGRPPGAKNKPKEKDYGDPPKLTAITEMPSPEIPVVNNNSKAKPSSFDPNVDASGDESNEYSDLADSDVDELPDAFAKTKFGPVKKGDLVWAKFYRFPYWPGVVRRVVLKRKRIAKVTILFIGAITDDQNASAGQIITPVHHNFFKYKGFTITYNPKKIKPFAETRELHAQFQEEGLNSVYQEQFKAALQNAEDFVMKRAMGEELDSFDYFDFNTDEICSVSDVHSETEDPATPTEPPSSESPSLETKEEDNKEKSTNESIEKTENEDVEKEKEENSEGKTEEKEGEEKEGEGKEEEGKKDEENATSAENKPPETPEKIEEKKKEEIYGVDKEELMAIISPSKAPPKKFSDLAPELAQSFIKISSRKVTGQQYIDVIKTEDTKEHVMKIFRKEVKSWRHDLFMKENKTKEERDTLEAPNQGPVADEEQQEEIVLILQDYVRVLNMTDPIKELHYVLYVLVPEAVIYAITKVSNVPADKAEQIFLEGAQFTEEEYALIKNELMANKDNIDTDDKEKYERKLEAAAEQLNIKADG